MSSTLLAGIKDGSYTRLHSPKWGVDVPDNPTAIPHKFHYKSLIVSSRGGSFRWPAEAGAKDGPMFCFPGPDVGAWTEWRTPLVAGGVGI